MTHIRLRKTEIQSGLDRVRWAEGLIKQLPKDHDGRNSWLLNYGGDKHLVDKTEFPTGVVIDDEMIDRLLRTRYPGEWPDDKIFDKVFPGGTETFRELCLRDARNELEAALNQGEPKQ